jgi:hypothetical protein
LYDKGIKMKHGIFTFILCSCLAGVCCADCGNMAPQGGYVLGVCSSYERVLDRNERTGEARGWLTVYHVSVAWDSTVTGERLPRGSTVDFYTPGGASGVEWIDFSNGEISSKSVMVHEKILLTYQERMGKLFITDKWTVWGRNVPIRMKTPVDRASVAVADARLEESIVTCQNKTDSFAFADSLILYHTPFDPVAFAYPDPKKGDRDSMKWNRELEWFTASSFLASEKLAGTIREVLRAAAAQADSAR